MRYLVTDRSRSHPELSRYDFDDPGGTLMIADYQLHALKSITKLNGEVVKAIHGEFLTSTNFS